MKEEKKIYRGDCPSCPGNEDYLSMDTVLYNGFGGYYVSKDGEEFYSGDPNGEWESFKTLKEIELEARINPGKWKVILNNPLRGATWERNNKTCRWILKETNLGFA